MSNDIKDTHNQKINKSREIENKDTSRDETLATPTP
jgi:hypothetical protein